MPTPGLFPVRSLRAGLLVIALGTAVAGCSLLGLDKDDASNDLNKDRQRFADEFVRHKILDAIGDMALAGAPLLARFQGVKSGHGLNNKLLRALFADPANYEILTLP